jgi:hypothetical protein
MKNRIMPHVLSCSVLECAYNEQKKCHAAAITVDGPEPMCDTFFKSAKKGGVQEEGAVGACKNRLCAYNESLECTAHGIDVSLHAATPECDTFTPENN